MRQLIQLVHHAQGVVTPVSLLMHLAAAVETRGCRNESVMARTRACVVVAGGREPVHWEKYEGHQFLHTIGKLPCCATGGCWKSRVRPLHDGSKNDKPENLCVDVIGDLPHCMYMVTAEDVIQSINAYLQKQENEISEKTHALRADSGMG